MAITLGLSGNKPYILNNLVLPTNTEILPDIPIKEFDKEYVDGNAILKVRLPFIANPQLSNEDYIKMILATIAAQNIISVKNISDRMILSLDYILSDSLGNIVSSEIKISDIKLSNTVILSKDKIDDVLSYRSGRKILSKITIDINRDRNLGIKYQAGESNKSYIVVIQGLDLFSEVIQAEGTFDNITESKYKDKVFNYIKTNYNSTEETYKLFIDKYFTEHTPTQYIDEYNRFWSCKDDYQYKTQYLLDKEVIGRNGVDIINSDMLKLLCPTPLKFEIKDVNKIIIELELFIETGDMTDINILEDAIINNRAKLDNIVLNSPAIESPVNP